MADSVLPGLNPYQPNHRITPPIGGDRHVVARWEAATVTLELAAETRPEHDRAGQGDHAADRVHHGGAGEVVQ